MPAAMELEANLNFLGSLPQHLKKGWAPKRNQPSLFKKAFLGRRCLLTQTMLFTRKCAVPPPLLPCRVTGSALESTDEPHAGKLARVVLAGDPGILY
ncbi:hypothetical protein LINGRAHAP2_LOCUS37586 [Linum grandiflorum]